jgi:hypothetical protein
MPASGRPSRLIWTRQHKRSDKPSPEHPHRLSSRCRAPLVSPPLSDNPIHPGTPPGPLGRFSSHAMFLASVIPWPPPQCLACHARHDITNPSHLIRPLSICKSATFPVPFLHPHLRTCGCTCRYSNSGYDNAESSRIAARRTVLIHGAQCTATHFCHTTVAH